MKLSDFNNLLTQFPDADLRFELPGGTLIAPHAHITEVGRVEKAFMDCGGTVRREVHCTLQAWVADDTQHRLKPSQLASILEKAAPLLGTDDLDVEIEYEDRLISQISRRISACRG